MDQFLYLLGRDLFARPGILPSWLRRCDGGLVPYFGTRPRRVLRLEDILEEWHGELSAGSLARGPVSGCRQRQITRGRTGLRGGDAGTRGGDGGTAPTQGQSDSTLHSWSRVVYKQCTPSRKKAGKMTARSNCEDLTRGKGEVQGRCPLAAVLWGRSEIKSNDGPISRPIPAPPRQP